MARIRTIKPEFFSSPDLKQCPDPWTRLLYIAMWNWADDWGRGVANPRELAGFAFPLDEEISVADVRRMLGGIRRAFGVEFYEVDGRPYYAIPSWEDHQKIDKRSLGKYPKPEDGTPYDPDPNGGSDLQVSGSRRASAEPSGDPAEPPPSPRRDLGAGTGEQGNSSSYEEEELVEDPDQDHQTEPREDVEALCRHLERRLVENGVKNRKTTKAWRTAARLLLDKDGRPLAEAHAVIDWCQSDSFWRSNIHSMPTFREQYDKLRQKAEEEVRARGGGRLRVAASNGERTYSAAEMDNVLGPDPWQLPPQPDDVSDAEYRAWARREWENHQADRVRQYEAKLAQRLAR